MRIYCSTYPYYRQPHAYLRFAIMLVLFVSCVRGSPVLVSRAIVRPIPMPGFSVSVFDDTTGAPIPQVEASDGGGLVNGRVFSAPNIVWAIAAAVIGTPLGAAGIKLWRVTTALGVGLSFAFAMWAALVNTISETGLASSQSMSDMLILLITGAAFLVGAFGGAFRFAVLPAMGASCAIGGVSVTTRIIILRPGLLVPPGLNDQLAFVNIVVVAVGILCGGLSVLFKQRGSMIFATASIGSFLIALTIDLLVNGQSGMSRGLRSLFDMNDNHLADLVGGGYRPPLSSQIIIACSFGLIPVFCLFQHYMFPGPFIQPRARDRTQSIADAPFNEKQSNVDSGQLPTNSQTDAPKPANDRRGSTAYNYGTGVFTLPSVIMRQLQESRRKVPTAEPIRQPPPPRQLQSSPPRRDRPSARAQRPPAALRGEPARPNFPAYEYGYAQDPTFDPPAGVAATYPVGVPGPPALERAGTFPARPPRPDASFPTPGPSYGQDGRAPVRDPGLQLTPRSPQPVAAAPTRLVVPPTINFAPASSPRLGIGLGMLRLSADSIIDAYGGTEDTGYRYGGSRTGQGGRI
ncbi:hypothetical protein FRC08_001911 [Ceratobasidium sp. 394]|nr:hypothetical protein FRC08_001911 [Ceratobasidium sp. 394]KAG9096020.1 hypothetical protein FS749_009259 [Ceratobasidium sp. UAMH 11750]